MFYRETFCITIMHKPNYTTRLFLREQAMRRDRKAPIYLRVTLNRKFKELNLYEYIVPEYWNDDERKLYVKDVPHAKAINKRIQAAEEKVDDIIEQLLKEEQPVTLELIVDLYKNQARSTDFITFIEAELKQNPGKKYAFDTLRTYRSKLKRLKEFRSTVNIHTVDYRFIRDFKDFLIKNYQVEESTAHAYLRFLKAFTKEAKRQKLTKNDPFEDYTLSDPEFKTKDVLTGKEVNQLYTLLKEGDLPGYLYNALFYFLLSCYTGLRDRDLLQCHPDNISDDQLVVKLHKGQRGKKKTVSIPIHQKSKELIYKVEKEHREPFVNQVANRYLKEVMQIAGINKHLTMHCGRHSFAVIGLNELGWSMELISHLLGHSSIDVTRKHYAKYQNSYKTEMMKRWDEL